MSGRRGTTSSLRWLMSRSLISRYFARMSTRPSFMNSEGWIEKTPKLSHALVLRTGVPKIVVMMRTTMRAM